MGDLLAPNTDLTFVPKVRDPKRCRPWVAPLSGSRIRVTGEGIFVELGAHRRAGDAALMLGGIRKAVTGNLPLTLVHRGAGGRSLLQAAEVEWPGLNCREIECGAQISFRPRSPRWTQHRLPDAAGHRPPTGVVIAGGLGGLGLEVAAHLAAAGHRLWLLDRRPVTVLPVAAQNRLAEIALRTHVVVDRADVTSAVPRRPFPVTQLVHAAGELELAPLRDTSPDDLERLAHGKAAALRVLVRALGGAGLRSVVVFGSTESRRPHRLFGGYALANEFLRREAAQLRRKHRRLRIVVAEWSLWSEVGMAAASAGMATGAGFATVPPAWGAQITELLLDERHPVPDEVVLGGPQPTADRPLSAIAGVGGSTVSHADESVNRLVELCKPTPADAHRPADRRGSVVRAVVTGRAVRTWGSGSQDWNGAEPGRPA